MRKFQYKTAYFLLSLFMVLTLSACKEEQQQARPPQGPVQVEVVTVAQSKIMIETELPGRTNAYRIAEVRPQVNGIIQKREFTEGSNVTQGELLYQIDPSTYQAQYDSAKANLAKAEASEFSAQLKAERYKNLVKTKAVSELDQIDIDATWKQAQADVAAAKAALNSAKINLDYTRITAPISGVIGRSLITEGALVTAQQSTALAKIQQLDPIYIDVTQSTTEMLRLRNMFSSVTGENNGQKKTLVTIYLDDGSAYDHQGTLEFSDVTVDQTTGAVTLRASVDNPDRKLLPGMFVRAKISIGEQEAIVVPAAALSRTQRGLPMVMVVNAESKVEARMIEIAKETKDSVIVQSGIEPGDKVIVAGLQYIRPGAQVAAVEQAEATAKQGE